MREATRGVYEYLITGKAPQLSICADRPVTDDRYAGAIEAIAEALLNWEMLDGHEVERIAEASRE